jgi:hypothetical protein
VLRTIEKIKNPVITSTIVFIAGIIDIMITVVVILNGLGVEANAYYNWIQPTWLMFYVMLAYNLILGLAMIPVLQRYPLHLPAYAYSFLRVMWGAVPGILILMGRG